MRKSAPVDSFDLKLLALLQQDGSLSSQALAEYVHLSPSQISRRRARLEAAGLIRGYRALLSAPALGYGVTALVAVRVSHRDQAGTRRFHDLIRRLPEVREAVALTGDDDYQLKVVARDMKALSELINDVILPHPIVRHVQSAVVLDVLKDAGGAPIDMEG